MLTLASRLRALDDAALRRTIEIRAISAHGIRDFFDLAEALLNPTAVQAALSRLDRSTLAVLAITATEAPAEPTDSATSSTPTSTTGGSLGLDALATRLTELGGVTVTRADVAARAAVLDELMLAHLSDDGLRVYAAVAEHLATWPDLGLPSALELASIPAPSALATVIATDSRFTDRLAAERAFSAVSSIAELVTELSREPVRELSRGGLGLPDTKRLSTVMGVELDAVATYVATAARAQLIAHSTGYWNETEAGEAWLLEGTAHRWAALAGSWQAALPADVRSILAHRPGVSWGEGLRSFVTWLYPAGGEWMDTRVTEFARDAELIGITAHQTTSPAGAAVLAEDLEGAIATIGASLPAEVGAVYLQNDLSIVSPGPLAPSIDARLRGLADVESRELALSYRISATSVNRALAAGETAESLLDFLRAISLTGIPQPIEYLIRESAGRYGRIRVGEAAAPTALSRSYVRSDDEELLGTLAVDQTLSPLGLVRADAHRLTSRFTSDVVFWALNDAKYPVAAENADGEILHLRRHQLARVLPPDAPDLALILVEKLRAADGGEDVAADAWLARQLDSAIKSKQTVIVSIAMPGGVVVDYLLEPASVGGGRFRARDRRADIERTLPLSSIISITPAP
ncbi:helicase-associated domain-containing protein [Cryobacterium zhongshanensis]|uniref:Helicase-associated domain-containing protein n=1 Tax=Cryobacterium zhongshanensis TaxID=2928153 RepID=A0AA41QU23_9MICO|nr:helicase-associated domain-containing protein [Cryobacterium zhongshanensis]MCI4656674.1 helicase-associated domain-containing protein [Cryobacterium zhongshanensis]